MLCIMSIINEKHRSGSAADLKYEVFQEEGTQRAGPLRPSYFLHKSFVSGIYYQDRLRS
jgi:hypothetical protein